MRKNLKKQADEQLRISRVISDAAASYLARESWTPITGAMLLSGIHPSSRWTEIPDLAGHQDHEPISFSEIFHSLRMSMKKPERGLDGTDVFPHSDRFKNVENILGLWDAICSDINDYPSDVSSRNFALTMWKHAHEGHVNLPEPIWIRVFVDHYDLKNPDRFVPRSVLDQREITPEERKFIPKHKFGKFIVNIWIETGKGVDPDVILARLAKTIENGAIEGTELVEQYSHRSDLRYKQASDRKPRTLYRDTLARQLRRMRARHNVASGANDHSAPTGALPDIISFIPRVPVDSTEFRRFSEPEQITELARKLMLETNQYVRFATLCFPAGGWKRDHAVVAGNVTRLSKQLLAVARLVPENLVDMVLMIGGRAIETMADIRFLCENLSPELVDDYIRNSSVNASTDGRWGGLDRLQRADAVGLRKTPFFDLADAPLHIHDTWKTVEYFHLDETQDGNYLPNLKGNTTHPQALLSLSMLSLETVLAFLQSTDRSDRIENLQGAIHDLHRRLTKADELSEAWFTGLQAPA